jgi:hypothetical protein
VSGAALGFIDEPGGGEQTAGSVNQPPKVDQAEAHQCDRCFEKNKVRKDSLPDANMVNKLNVLGL